MSSSPTTILRLYPPVTNSSTLIGPFLV